MTIAQIDNIFKQREAEHQKENQKQRQKKVKKNVKNKKEEGQKFYY
jgi:hypothetical protein